MKCVCAQFIMKLDYLLIVYITWLGLTTRWRVFRSCVCFGLGFCGRLRSAESWTAAVRPASYMEKPKKKIAFWAEPITATPLHHHFSH